MTLVREICIVFDPNGSVVMHKKIHFWMIKRKYDQSRTKLYCQITLHAMCAVSSNIGFFQAVVKKKELANIFATYELVVPYFLFL